jgi:hypothetical protein
MVEIGMVVSPMLMDTGQDSHAVQISCYCRFCQCRALYRCGWQAPVGGANLRRVRSQCAYSEWASIEEGRTANCRSEERKMGSASSTPVWAKSHELQKQAREFSKEYGLYCLKLLSVSHGAAVAAIFGFFVRVPNNGALNIEITSSARPAFFFFVGGLIATIFSSFVAFLNWGMLALDDPSTHDRWIKSTFWISIVLGLISACLFVAGAWKIWSVTGPNPSG